MLLSYPERPSLGFIKSVWPTLKLVFLYSSVEIEESGHLYEKSTMLHCTGSRMLARQHGMWMR